MFQISTAPEPESNKFAQSTSRSNTSNIESRQSTTRKSESSLTLTPNVKEISKNSPKSVDSGKSKKAKRLQAKAKKHLKNKNKSNLTISDNESINIDVNIQDVTLQRTLTKRNFFKKKKLSVNN